jgi:DNA repair exonuclease SbcCD ATPase subunit
MYCDSNYNRYVVGDPSCPELKNNCEQLSDELKNPFLEFHNWILGEISDIESLQESIQCRDRTIAHRGKLESKKKANIEELNKLNAGKKTLKSIFKSASGKQTKITELTAMIAQLEKDIEEMDKLVKMVEVHLGEAVVPKFKEVQMKHYYKICQSFACMEIDDSNKTAVFWASFLENSNIKMT